MGPIHTLAIVQSYQDENITKMKVFNDNFHSNFTVTENMIFNKCITKIVQNVCLQKHF